MNWMQEHLGSMGHLGDFYIPQSGGDAGNGNDKKTHIAGTEQIQTTDKDWEPEIIRSNQKYQRIQKFYEWEQFLNWVDWPGKKYRRASHRIGDKNYKYTRTWTFQEAMDLARYGWAEGVSKIQQFEKLDLPTHETFMQNYDIQTAYSVAGGSVNIGRYLAGMPDCMRHMRTSNHHALPSRVQKIIIISNSSGRVLADEILKYGYKIYQIIEALEMANVQTDITLAYSAKNYNTEQISDYCFYETYIDISFDLCYNFNNQLLSWRLKWIFLRKYFRFLSRFIFVGNTSPYKSNSSCQSNSPTNWTTSKNGYYCER